jgi:hypothetical protein
METGKARHRRRREKKKHKRMVRRAEAEAQERQLLVQPAPEVVAGAPVEEPRTPECKQAEYQLDGDVLHIRLQDAKDPSARDN